MFFKKNKLRIKILEKDMILLKSFLIENLAKYKEFDIVEYKESMFSTNKQIGQITHVTFVRGNIYYNIQHQLVKEDLIKSKCVCKKEKK